MALYPPRGLIIALVTPFDEKGEIDWPSLERLVEKSLPFVDGLLIGEGRIGEGLSLPNPKRLELLRGAIHLLYGKKPLFLCPTASSEDETLRNLEEASNHAAQRSPSGPLFWVDIPLWYHSNRKLSDLYAEWKKRTPFSILVYNHPQLISELGQALKRKNIRTSLLHRLSENEQIVGMIYTGDLRRAIDYQRAVRLSRDFLFYDGQEKNFLNQPSSSGVVSSGANLFPDEWKSVVTASLGLPEDPAANMLLLKHSQKLRALHEILRANPAQSIKWALHRLGVIRSPKVFSQKSSASREPLSPLEAFLKENFSLQLPT